MRLDVRPSGGSGVRGSRGDRGCAQRGDKGLVLRQEVVLDLAAYRGQGVGGFAHGHEVRGYLLELVLVARVLLLLALSPSPREEISDSLAGGQPVVVVVVVVRVIAVGPSLSLQPRPQLVLGLLLCLRLADVLRGGAHLGEELGAVPTGALVPSCQILLGDPRVFAPEPGPGAGRGPRFPPASPRWRRGALSGATLPQPYPFYALAEPRPDHPSRVAKPLVGVPEEILELVVRGCVVRWGLAPARSRPPGRSIHRRALTPGRTSSPSAQASRPFSLMRHQF